MKKSKIFKERAALVNREKLYNPDEALKLLKKISYASYTESVEAHFNLDIDTRHADQQLRGTFVLPNGTGKTTKVVVIAEGEQVNAAKEAGADDVGSDEIIQKIQGGWLDFDILITVPSMMRKLGKLGKLLGSKGLMPNPKLGTVTNDVAKAVKEFKSGKFEYRNDKEGNLHIVIGKVDFAEKDLLANFNALYDFVEKIKPAKAKGTYFKSIALCSTQSPSIFIEPIKMKWNV